jgi:hypothetical protein
LLDSISGLNFFKPFELANSLLQRQTAQFGHVDRPVEPVVGVALPEVEVSLAFLNVNVIPELFKFVIYRFEREAHDLNP